jgi:signal peptidase I
MLTVTTAEPVTRPRIDPPGVSRRFAIVRFGVGLLAVSAVTVVAILAMCAAVLPKLVGWTPVAVVSGSMEPAIGVGDVLVAEPYHGQPLQPGRVLVFHDPAGSGLVSHRLSAINDDGTLTTRGDANAGPDSTPVDPAAVVGVGRLLVPAVGWPTVWFGRNDAFHLAIAALVALAVLYASRWGLLLRFDPWQGAPGSPTDLGPTDDPVCTGASRVDAAARPHRIAAPDVSGFDPSDSERFAALHPLEYEAAEAWLAAELTHPARPAVPASTGFSDHLTRTMIPVRRPIDGVEQVDLADASR